MKKIVCSALVGSLAAMVLIATPNASSAATHTEGFETVLPAGWSQMNASYLREQRSIFQGFPDYFAAHQGPPDSYAAMDYGATATDGTDNIISQWLITPVYTELSNGDRWSFHTRAFTDLRPERVEVWMSTDGECGTGLLSPWDTGHFTKLLATINPNLTATGYPTAWTKFSGTLSGIEGVTSGCLALRSHLPNAGVRGVNGHTVGFDTYRFSEAAETSILSGPAGNTEDKTPTFGFASSAPGSGFECAVDSAAFRTCSGPRASHTTAALSRGPHTFRVRSRNADAVDVTPATRSFTVIQPACTSAKSAVNKADVAVNKASKKLESANRTLKNATKRLKAAKKHGSKKDISKAKNKVKKAAGKAKRAKSTFKKAQSAQNRANSSWAACRRG